MRARSGIFLLGVTTGAGLMALFADRVVRHAARKGLLCEGHSMGVPDTVDGECYVGTCERCGAEGHVHVMPGCTHTVYTQ